MYRGLLIFVVTFFCTCDISFIQSTFFDGSYTPPNEYHSLTGTKLHEIGRVFDAAGNTADAIIGKGKEILGYPFHAFKNKFAGGGAVNANFDRQPVALPYTLPPGYTFTNTGGLPVGYLAVGYTPTLTNAGSGAAGGYVPTSGSATFTSGGGFGPVVGYVPASGGATFTAGGGSAGTGPALGSALGVSGGEPYREYIDAATGARVRIPEALAHLFIHN